ncbi:hypothetical protein [Yoonia sediminilitoris]|uniref:hypothetical protein n=1 Tax=Yoonia sediminilitoris TaxID=1286148 RepID=UPI0014551106|nr:hypothetical protein [Yoonia sediminilitoris]
MQEFASVPSEAKTVNDRFGDVSCNATTNMPQTQSDAASAKFEKQMTVLSRSTDLNASRSERQIRADCVEKLVGFGPLMLVTTLISFGCS